MLTIYCRMLYIHYRSQNTYVTSYVLGIHLMLHYNANYTDMTTSDELCEPVGSSSPDNNAIHSLLNELEGAQSGQTPLSLAVLKTGNTPLLLAVLETGYTETHQVKNLQAFAVPAEKKILALPDKGNPSTMCAVHCSVNACWCMLGNYSIPFCGGLLQHYSV